MVDEQNTAAVEPTTEQPATPAGAQNTEQPAADHMVPKSRFDEVNTELKKLKAQAAEAEKARQQAEHDRLKEQGEWQKIADAATAKLAEIEPAYADTATKLQRYEAALTVQVSALRKELPKHLAPLLDKLDLAEQLEWLASNREQIAPPKPNGVPATPRAQGSNDAAQEAAARAASAAFYRDF